ncbi:hypothetical protein ACGFOU_33200 [Streptomyces sp. NPDC048595]|uniref:hypothetical protein n=1 Tax=Streptomyces sp. NPDC048595 TaxID=3365576 RepID=UPI003723AB37
MRDPSANWDVPFDAAELPDQGLTARLARSQAHDAWRALVLAQRQADESPGHAHAYGVALLGCGMPFAAGDVLTGLVARADGDRPDAASYGRRVDLATAGVRSGFWDGAMGQLLQVAEELLRKGLNQGRRWEDLADRCRRLHRSRALRDEERTFQRLRIAWLTELAGAGEATTEHRLARARAHLALGELDADRQEYDRAGRLLLALADDPGASQTALELLVGLHLRAGPEHQEDRERARSLLHKANPHSRVLREGSRNDEGRRWMAGLEAYHATTTLLLLSREAGDAEPGPRARRRLGLLARAHPDQPRYAVAAALALLAHGELAAATDALAWAQAPLTAEDHRALADAFTQAGRPDLARAHRAPDRSDPTGTE